MELRLSPSFPTRSLSLGSHRRRWPGSRHLLQVFLRQTGAGTPQLSSARCYLAGPVRSLSLSASAHLQTEARPSPLPPGGSRCSLHDTPHAATQSWEPLSVRAQAVDAKGLILAGGTSPRRRPPRGPLRPGPAGPHKPEPFHSPRPAGHRARSVTQAAASLPEPSPVPGRSPRAHLDRSMPTAPAHHPGCTHLPASPLHPTLSLEPPYQPHPRVHTLGISAL